MFPTSKISDQTLAQALGWVVAVAVPLLDAVAETDVLHLKQREPGGHGSSKLGGAADRAASFVQARNLPGTAGWRAKTVHERSQWWAKRVGAIGSAVAGAPGVFGALSDRLPVHDAFGFATQAVTLCAVAREYGVSEREDLVQMLAEVLCGRKLDKAALAASEGPAPFQHKNEGKARTSWAKLVRGLWRITQIVRSVSSELGKRPHGSSFYRLVGKLPVVGAVGDFLYESGGVRRAADAGERWLNANGSPARRGS